MALPLLGFMDSVGLASAGGGALAGALFMASHDGHMAVSTGCDPVLIRWAN